MIMKGREEHNMEYERRIQKRLENAPIVLKDYMCHISSFTASSRQAYLGYIMDFLKFLMNTYEIDGTDYSQFTSLKKLDIDKYMEHTKINPNTGKINGASIRNAKLVAVTNFFDFLLENEYIDRNPCRNVKKIKDNVEREIVYLSKEEIDDVKATILSSGRGYNYNDPWVYRDYAIFILGCSTGLRNSAIREINLSDLDFDKKEVYVTEKNDVTKKVRLGENTCNALQKWIEVRGRIIENKNKDCDALFISNQIKRITDVTLATIVKKYTEHLGKHITPHKMRSTCGMNLYEASGDIYLVAQQLGHKNIKNTQKYARATEKQLRRAVEILDSI